MINDGTAPLLASAAERDVENGGSEEEVAVSNLRERNNACPTTNNINGSANLPFNLNTRFAADRTYLAADRTVIAWVRTAMSMIGFGVTLAEGADYLESQGLVENARTLYMFGILFVGSAWIGLVLVIVQNIRLERRIAATGYPREESAPLGLSMAIFMLVVCAAGVFVVLRDEFGVRQ